MHRMPLCAKFHWRALHAGIACEEAQRRHFLRIWNLKEAYCKAQGLGIVTTMRHSTFTLLRPGKPACKHFAGADSPPDTSSTPKLPQGTWQIMLEPADERAAVVMIDVDEAHSAALCTYRLEATDSAGQRSAGTVSHFWLSRLDDQGVCTAPAAIHPCC